MYNDEHLLSDEQIQKLSDEYSKDIKVSVYQNGNAEEIKNSSEVLFYLDFLQKFTGRNRVRQILQKAYNSYYNVVKNQNKNSFTPLKGSFNKKLYHVLDLILEQIQSSTNSTTIKELSQVFGELLAILKLSLF